MVAMSIISIVVVFYNLTNYIVPTISKYYDEKFSDGIIATVQCLELSDVEKLKEMGAKEVTLEYTGGVQFDYSSVSINDTEVIDIDKDFKWFTDTESENQNLKEEFKYEDFNYSNNAIIYCNEKDAQNYNENDELKLYLKNKTLIGKYKIIKVLVDNNYARPYVIFPALAIIKDMNKCGVCISYSMSCKIDRTSRYIDFKSKVEAKNAYCTSKFDDMLGLIGALELAFKILAIVFIVISLFTIVIISLIIINNREKFIVLQKVLGFTNLKIECIYVSILEIQIITANILGFVIGIKYTKYLTSIVSNLYSTINIKGEINYIWICLASIIISNIAMIPYIFILNKIINKKDVISIINNKE